MTMGFNIGAVALRLSTLSTWAQSHNPAGWAAHAAHGFLAALEAGSPRPGCRQGWVLARTHFLACTRPPPRCVLTWWCGELCRPILAGHKRLRGARPHGLIGPDHLPTAPPSSTPHRGWRFNVGIWGDTIQTIAFWPLGPQNSCPSHMRGTLIPSLFGLTPCLLPSVGRRLRLRGSGRAFSPGGSAHIRLDVSLGWGGAPSRTVSGFLGPPGRQ